MERIQEESPLAPVLDGPAVVNDAIVFELQDDEAAKLVWEEYANGKKSHTGASAACEYVRSGGGHITPLDEDRAAHVWVDGLCRLAMPGTPVRSADVNLSAAHHLRLAHADDGGWLLSELTRDRRVKRAFRPAVQYPLDAPVPVIDPTPFGGLSREGDLGGLAQFARETGGGFKALEQLAMLAAAAQRAEEQWGLDRCGFRKVWERMEAKGTRGSIAVIDYGGDTGHPELLGRVTEKNVLAPGQKPSTSTHASAVAGVISALRDPPSGIAGCCLAPIELYNVWSDKGFDSLAFLNALKAVRTSGVKVVNLSLGSRVRDDVVAQHVKDCLSDGLTLVAAAGNNGGTGNDLVYPAAYDGVIAVGATNPSGNRAEWSAHGNHLHVSAPGLFILSVYGADDLRFWSGTSFAAPMVAAAVWMILNVQPGWTRAEVTRLLATSSTGRGRRTRDTGYGVLDMERVADCALNGSIACP